MKIRGLHKNIYKLYSYSRPQECLEAYRQKYRPLVKTWEKLRKEGVCPSVIQDIAGMSRSTYYRQKKALRDLDHAALKTASQTKQTEMG